MFYYKELCPNLLKDFQRFLYKLLELVVTSKIHFLIVRAWGVNILDPDKFWIFGSDRTAKTFFEKWMPWNRGIQEFI